MATELAEIQPNLDPSKDREPLYFSFNVRNYTVKIPNPEKKKPGQPKTFPKQLLKDVKGYARDGELMAIMGASGAGKTTLLTLLADRIRKSNNNKLDKTVNVNGKELEWTNFGKLAAYVMQDDYLFATLTPRECIRFVVNLRMKDKTANEKEEKVDDVLAELGLLKCADTLVGSHFIKGISGGERKRTSVAVEVVTNPKILFLDEPTSGLDTTTAYVLCKVLKKMANRGKIVIATIHQPSSEIFFLFDKLVLLNLGKLVYQGPTKDSTSYFQSAGFSCPEFSNPAEYYMKIMQPKLENQEKKPKPTRKTLVKLRHQTSPNNLLLNGNTGSFPQSLRRLRPSLPAHPRQHMDTIERVIRPFVDQRQTEQEDDQDAYSDAIVFALLGMALYWDTDDTKTGVDDKMGLFMFCCINQFMAGVQSVILAFPIERAVFLKEYSGRLYDTGPYFIAKNVPELPLQLLFPALFATIIYLPSGLLLEFDKYLLFVVGVLAISFCGISFGYFLSTAMTDTELISSIGPVTLIPFMLASGFFVNLDDIGVWAGWLAYVSPLRYGMETLTTNEFEGRSGLCHDKDEPCEPVDDFNFDLGLAPSLTILICLMFGLRFIAYIALRLRAKTIG
eukprot:CAMPEP_0115037682 /NCGR_PEP_ID=MMETSP0216-20121206/42956_1 /TAXON_ID=223996 /ORGANISM="Protocruzia adherens, Strain Boccale" /LENGTH=617 /DNA_ID=CAMNT_0002417933 /DNA_START=140 /DNA_END=1994 /DNA_ORIENTATION=+